MRGVIDGLHKSSIPEENMEIPAKEMISYFFICENDPACVVQRRLEGEASQVVVVLEVDVIPLHHQSRP